MKISSNTISILKNFSSINQSIQFRKGDVITTVSQQSTIVGQAKVAESFPVDFAIYELPRFFGLLSIPGLEDPDYEFKSTHVVLNGTKVIKTETGEAKTVPSGVAYKYFFADPSTVKSFNKKLNMPENTLSVNVSEDDIKRLLRANSVASLPELLIAGDGENIIFTALDTKNDSLGSLVIRTEQETDKTFELLLKFDNLKIVEGPYTVLLSNEIVNFKHTAGNLQYWVAAEANAGL